MIVDCIADLHGHYPVLEGGDLLIVAGDLTKQDKPYEYIQFGLWLNEQKYRRKILIAGNHDNMLQKTPSSFKGLPDFAFTYLCDSGTEFEGLKIWGSPWTVRFEDMNPHCMAFTVDTDEELAEKWKLIPSDTDILVTHSPAYGMRDSIKNLKNKDRECVGSRSLQMALWSRVKPRLMVVGHVHEEYGQDPLGGIVDCYVNASHVNEDYKPVNKPIRIEL